MFETFLLAGGLVAGILIFLKLFARKRKPSTRVRSVPVYEGSSHHKVVKAVGNSRYAAVSCNGHCSAIRGLQGKRFLEREAPTLPVPGCTAARCDCVYTHHDDRRTGKRDRRGLSQISKEFFEYSGKPNQRQRVGRRLSDIVIA